MALLTPVLRVLPRGAVAGLTLLALAGSSLSCRTPAKREPAPLIKPPLPEEDPNAPIPYPAPQLPASRLLGRTQEASWTPLPPYSEERASAAVSEIISRFSRRSDLHRQAARSKKSRQMPALQGQNWREFLSELDEVMVRVPASTFETEMLRAQRTLQIELEADASVYPEIPSTIVDAVLERETKFGLRALKLSRSQKRKSKVRPYGVPEDEQPDPLDPWTDPGTGYFAWPVAPVTVTSLFGRRFHPIHKTYRPHQGLDLAAPTGHEIWAAAEGRVIRASWHGSHGNHVEIKHPNGDVTGYSHLSKILVKVGAKVEKGQRVGLSGMTGGATGPHLHFEIWRNGKALDPLLEFGDPPDDLRAAR